MTYAKFITPFIELRRKQLFQEIEEEIARKEEIINKPVTIRWRKDRYI